MSAEWLVKIVEEPNLYPGKVLKVARAASLHKPRVSREREPKPKLLKVTVWVSGKAIDFEDMKRRIHHQDRTLNAHEWVQYAVKEQIRGQLVTFRMPESALEAMEAVEYTVLSGIQILLSG